MAILCTLVEFLEATRQGKKFTLLRRENFQRAKDEKFHLIDPPFNPNNEYFLDSQYFIDFLKKRKPFDEVFAGGELAQNFYDYIRCGLLHEAQTKKGWKIKTLVGGCDECQIEIRRQLIGERKCAA